MLPAWSCKLKSTISSFEKDRFKILYTFINLHIEDLNVSFLHGKMDRKLVLGKENKIVLPSTPDLKRLGYGTGVGIFHVSPRGNFSSPWALKKLMRGTKCNQTIMGKRLRNEANILRKLNHPNIVGFRAFLTTKDGRECLAMEECHMSLSGIIEGKEEEGPFPVNIISKVAFEIAKALDYIHNTVHLLHGDIKSPNVLIKGNFDAIKLCDFGVSLPLKTDGTLDKDSAGKEAVYIGTNIWSAPEVCEKVVCQCITDKADIFAYGLTIWEMLATTAPHCPDISDVSDSSFDEDAYEEMLQELIGTRPPIPEFVKKDASYSKIVSLFIECTEEDYQNRFSAIRILQFCNENNIQ